MTEGLYTTNTKQSLGVKVYFADAHAPWQRGSNENVNGLFRFFFPRGTDFTKVTDEQLDAVLELINNRPNGCGKSIVQNIEKRIVFYIFNETRKTLAKTMTPFPKSRYNLIAVLWERCRIFLGGADWTIPICAPFFHGGGLFCAFIPRIFGVSKGIIFHDKTGLIQFREIYLSIIRPLMLFVVFEPL